MSLDNHKTDETYEPESYLAAWSDAIFDQAKNRLTLRSNEELPDALAREVNATLRYRNQEATITPAIAEEWLEGTDAPECPVIHSALMYVLGLGIQSRPNGKIRYWKEDVRNQLTEVPDTQVKVAANMLGLRTELEGWREKAFWEAFEMKTRPADPSAATMEETKKIEQTAEDAADRDAARGNPGASKWESRVKRSSSNISRTTPSYPKAGSVEAFPRLLQDMQYKYLTRRERDRILNGPYDEKHPRGTINIHEYLHCYRYNHELSWDDIEEVGIKQNRWRTYERGEVIPPVPTIVELKALTGTDTKSFNRMVELLIRARLHFVEVEDEAALRREHKRFHDHTRQYEGLPPVYYRAVVDRTIQQEAWTPSFNEKDWQDCVHPARHQGEYIRAMMLLLKITPEQMAREIGCAITGLHDAENETRTRMSSIRIRALKALERFQKKISDGAPTIRVGGEIIPVPEEASMKPFYDKATVSRLLLEERAHSYAAAEVSKADEGIGGR